MPELLPDDEELLLEDVPLEELLVAAPELLELLEPNGLPPPPPPQALRMQVSRTAALALAIV